MTGKRAQNKQANREAILDAARYCFLADGYDAITIRDIIRRSGLAAGTFYNYFPDKESVFRALVESRLGVIQERIHTARSKATSVESFFHEAYLATFEEVRADPDFFHLMFRNEPVVRAFYQDSVFGLLMRSLGDDLRDAITRGVFPAIDVDALTAVSFGAGYELVRMLAEQPHRDPAKLARFVTQLFTEGIGRAAPQVSLIRLGSRLLGGIAR